MKRRTSYSVHETFWGGWQVIRDDGPRQYVATFSSRLAALAFLSKSIVLSSLSRSL